MALHPDNCGASGVAQPHAAPSTGRGEAARKPGNLLRPGRVSREVRFARAPRSPTREPSPSRGTIEMQPFRTLLPVLIPLVLISCTDPVTQPAASVWEGTLTSEAPRAGFTGQVAAASQFGATTASIALERGEPGATYSWHLIRGTCGQTSGSIVPPDRYPPLVLTSSGAAQANATINQMLDPGGSYAAVVHAEDGVRRLACGNLARR
jgi:hypothetical protein